MRSPFARVPYVAGLLIVAVALSAGLAYARFTPGDSAGATQLVTGSISGIVTDQATGLPIEGAVVEADPRTAYVYSWGTATTAADGSYTISFLSPGGYSVFASASGHVPEYFDNTINFGLWTIVNVAEGSTTGGIDLGLGVGGAASGIVTDQGTGLPIQGATVQLIGDSFYSEFSEEYVTTAADGSYTARFLFPGNYQVRVYADGYLEEFFDSAYTLDAATVVVLTESATTGPINIALSAGEISGIVTDQATGLPIAGAMVTVPNYPYYNYPVTTAADGSYSMPGLRPGNYSVRAYANGYVQEYFNNVYNSGDATLVAVTGGAPVGGIDFALGPGGSISGTVRDLATNLPIAGAFVGADNGTCCEENTTTAADGSYSITGLAPGDYRVRASASGYVPEYFNNAYDHSAATLVAVAEGPPVANVNLVLGAGASLSGTVTLRGTGLPIAGAYVNVTRDICCGSPSATTAADGSFTFTALPPGNYRVYATGIGHVGQYFNNAFTYQSATLVEIAADEVRVGIDFALLPSDSDLDADTCPDAAEIANMGYKEPDNFLDRSDYPNFDGDGRVDFDDFMMFARVYGTLASAGVLNQRADLDSDSFVDFEDFVIFAAAYGRRCL